MKSPILGLAVSTVAFGASSIYLWTQLDEQREQAAAVRQANAELTRRIVDLEKRRADIVEQRMGGPGVFTPPARVEAGAAPAIGPPAPEKRPVWTAIKADPGHEPRMPEAMVKMMRANVRAQNKRMYFDLQSKLGLTDDQTSDLLDLLTEQQTATFKGPRTQDPEAAREWWENEQARRQTALEDLLGPAKSAEFAEYQKTMPARSELMMISQQLEGVDTPLTDGQRSRLLDVLVEERDRIPMPGYVEGTPQEDMMKAYNDWQADYEKRVADAARGILTAEQLNTYNEYQQWQREMRQQFAAQAPVGGPPVRMLRGDRNFFVPASGAAVSFAVGTDPASSSPTEKPANSK
jgi:hypothetical protein